MNLRKAFLAIFGLLLTLNMSAQIVKQSHENQPTKMKIGIVGSYPQHVDESSWVSGWVHSGTQDIQYSTNGDIEIIVREDGSGKTRELYTYNEDGENVESITQQWVDGDWENMIRERENIDDDGNYLGYTVESWSNGAWVLEEAMEFQYQYEGNNISVMILRSKQVGQDWMNSQKYTYSYDGNSEQPATVIIEAWENEAWVNSMMIDYEYNDEKTTTQIQSMYLDGSWSLYLKIVTTEEENGSFLMTNYSQMGTDWLPSSRTTYSNDTHGNETLYLVEMYIGEWTPFMGTQFLLTYEGDKLLERITQTTADNEPVKSNGMKSLSWVNTFKEEFSNFHSASTGLISKHEISAVVFPNPASDYLSVKISNPGVSESLDLQIFNLKGQEVLNKGLMISGGSQIESIPLMNIGKGTYILTLKNQSSTFTFNKVIQIQ